MVKNFIFLLILVSLTIPEKIAAQRTAVSFKNEIFTGVYSEVYEQPLWVTYKVLCPTGTIPRNGMDFYTNDSIKTSDDSDYRNNEYDKGHLAPAADFNCDKRMLLKTFSYLNCALQQENLNRGVWRLLESHERELAKTGSNVTVKVELTFSVKSKKLPTGATVPDGFTKTIILNGKVVEKYYFPNVLPPKGKKYQDYMVKF